MIEGNRLEPDQIEKVIKKDEQFVGRERDEKEVKGYYTALTRVEQWAAQGALLQLRLTSTNVALSSCFIRK